MIEHEPRKHGRRRLTLSVAIAAAALAASAGVAQAQFYGWGGYRTFSFGWGEPDVVITRRPAPMASPGEVRAILAEHGLRLTGPMRRNGSVYVADVEDRRGRPQRVVVDAIEGDIVQRFSAEGPPRPPRVVGRDRGPAFAAVPPYERFPDVDGYPPEYGAPRVVPGVGGPVQRRDLAPQSPNERAATPKKEPRKKTRAAKAPAATAPMKAIPETRAPEAPAPKPAEAAKAAPEAAPASPPAAAPEPKAAGATPADGAKAPATGASSAPRPPKAAAVPKPARPADPRLGGQPAKPPASEAMKTEPQTPETKPDDVADAPEPKRPRVVYPGPGAPQADPAPAPKADAAPDVPVAPLD